MEHLLRGHRFETFDRVEKEPYLLTLNDEQMIGLRPSSSILLSLLDASPHFHLISLKSKLNSSLLNALNPLRSPRMGAEAKLYLQQHSIPQLFEGLMTGLIYNRPQEPLRFLETAIAQIRANPEEELKWDMFIDKTKFNTSPKEKGKKSKLKEKNKEKGVPQTSSGEGRSSSSQMGRLQRAPSVMKAAEVAQIPHVPIILFMGGSLNFVRALKDLVTAEKLHANHLNCFGAYENVEELEKVINMSTQIE
ncbi:hypothetical protein KIN20_023176 [Parelaphostrongylus tenuis]|uniref:Uncharacterized protein n=1 Tax=Parelaphostrongylus tenuis TaxID=148309 RepID=A0AAD5MRL9_PARTN|nr:hypothetical protein KIN20_023176 [Parelaphostrongylus tenuis]